MASLSFFLGRTCVRVLCGAFAYLVASEYLVQLWFHFFFFFFNINSSCGFLIKNLLILLSRLLQLRAACRANISLS